MSWVLAGICSHFVGFKLRPLFEPLWKPTKKARAAAQRSVVEKENSQVQGAAGGLRLWSTLTDGSLKTDGEEQWA